jgi:hypothetical protein
LTFTTELDDLIRFGHGDVKRLRNIRDTVKHDNFITIEDKKYVESLISTHLRNQPLDESEPRLTRKLTPKRSVPANSSTSNFSNNKKLGITAGVAAAIALIVVAGFFMQTMDQTNTSTSSETITTSNVPLAISADSTSYKKADIISISGSLKSTSTSSIELSIENTAGDKIWNEFVSVKNNGKFSTLVIAGGGGWESNGVYTLKGKQGDLQNELEFNFST